MNADDMTAVRQAITNITTQEARQIAVAVCALETVDEVKRILAETAKAIACLSVAAHQDVSYA